MIAMTQSDLDQIFARVEDGVDDAELKRVAAFVLESKEPALQRRGLHILGWSRAREYIPLIASFLDRTDDLSLPAMAIRALVRWFRNAAPYADTLKHFLLGILQDEGHDLQLTALQIAGDAYRQTLDLDLLRMITTFTNNDSKVFRNAAYDALVIALSPDWERLSPRQRYDLQRLPNRESWLEQARNLLRSHSSVSQ